MIVIEGGELAEYVILLFGCHDVTALNVELTSTEAALMRALSVMSRNEAESDCQPRLSIVKFNHPDREQAVSIDEQDPIPYPFGDRARLRLAGGVDEGPASWPRRLGRGGGLRALPVDDALPDVVGEDRPR